MRISCSMICWNEETTIDLSLKSIADFADEVVIVDTGSFDNTLKVAQETMDNLKLSGQIKKKTVTKLLDARLESFLLCESDWILMQDSNLVLSNNLKREIVKHSMNNPNLVGAIKSLNMMGDYNHYFENRPYMVYHKIFVNRERAQWDTTVDRPKFQGKRKDLTHWAVNLSRVRPAWRSWYRGEPFDRRYYKIGNDHHSYETATMDQWGARDKYSSIVEYVEKEKGITLEQVKKIAPAWYLNQLRIEATPLSPPVKKILPEVIREELKDPRYKLIYKGDEIVGRWPEL